MKLYKKILHKLFFHTAEKNAKWYKENTDIIMGENVKIFPGVHISSEPFLISIGNDVEITDGVRLLTHDGAVKVAMKCELCENADIFGRIIIGNNVFIGVNSIIMPGVEIGNNVIIGAGSIVTKNIPDNSVVAGQPAHIISTIEEWYIKNEKFILKTDNLSYSEKKKYITIHNDNIKG